MLTDAEIMAQVWAAFQAEQAEHRQAIGELLLELERNPDHPQRQKLLDQLFREAHSLKGGARAAGQPAVEQIAHHLEDVISAVRQGTLSLTPELCDPIYAALDAIDALVGRVAAGQPVDLALHSSILETLTRAVEGAGRAPAADTGALARPAARDRDVPGVYPPNTEAPPAAAETTIRIQGEHPPNTETPPAAETTIRIQTAIVDSLLNEIGELTTCGLRSAEHRREVRHLVELTVRWRRGWRRVRPIYARLQERMGALRPTIHYLGDRDELPSLVSEPRLDYDAAILLETLKETDALMGDLEQHLARHGQELAEAHAQLAASVERMHAQIRQARMLPLATIFGQIRLQARDMARAAGKQLALDVDDGGAVADRPVLERLREIITHLVRNALDHGIETPDLRAARGKAPEGRVTLRASVSGDRLICTLADDGAGLDLEAIRRQALASGWVSESDLARMGESELVQLIFLPGFSTRETVSTLSGRGVGLDIVRSQVERMHGRVDVQNIPGQGCRFLIAVPLSLTSAHGLLVRAGEASYAIPLDAVQRIIPVAPSDIQMLEGRASLVLDGRPLPLVSLAGLLGAASPDMARPAAAQRLALVLGSGERQVAGLVDDVLRDQELVTHRLPPPLQQVRFIAGATILPDGRIVPILDVVDLIEAAIGTRQAHALTLDPATPRRSPTVLVVDDSLTTRTLEKNILEAAGYQVRLATDGAEALQILDQLADGGDCDLLLSDVDMPRLNGFELAAQVRASQRFKHLPIVLVTSLDTPADRERGIAAGADAYIVKRAFEQQALLETIAELI
jgi:two-component system, chemotaxis family, sensor kinase CheA